ncbi:MAG: universal stress protein [Lewinellaceae bacterium]|nr:universal stress protein [Lewinellaceae bacterium]
MKVTPGVYRCVVEENLNLARLFWLIPPKMASTICISTRGAGGLGKIIGTYTSSVMHHSPVPVLAKADSWRTRNIKKYCMPPTSKT